MGDWPSDLTLQDLLGCGYLLSLLLSQIVRCVFRGPLVTIVSFHRPFCFLSGLVSVVFLWITVAAIVWPEQVVKELFIIPITALFAFTSVRANLPGSPVGFGEVSRLFFILVPFSYIS